MIRQSNTYTLRTEESEGKPRYFVSFKDGQAIMREVEVNREIYLVLDDCRKHEKRQRSFYERHIEYSELTDETLNDRTRLTPKTIEDTITDMERSEVLQKAIAELPEIQQRRFVLYCDEGMTYAAISDEEQNQILLALQSMAATQYVNGDELLSKLSALFDKADTDWMEVDFSRFGNTEPDKARFEMLKQAILGRQAITFSYPSSYGEITNRTVYPLKLVFKSKAWYLLSYCLSQNDYRTFKINRMLSIAAMTSSFNRQDYTPPPMESSDKVSPILTHLRLQFAPYVAYRVYDEVISLFTCMNGISYC